MDTDQPKTPEEILRQSHALIEQRLEAQNRELSTLLAVQQAITSHLDRQSVLQMIADGARQLTYSRGFGSRKNTRDPNRHAVRVTRL